MLPLFDLTLRLCAITLAVEVRISCFSLRNTTKGKLAATESHERGIDSGEFTNASATAQVAFGGVEVNKDETGLER